MSDRIFKNNNKAADFYYFEEELKIIQRAITLLRQDLLKFISEEFIEFNNHKQQER